MKQAKFLVTLVKKCSLYCLFFLPNWLLAQQHDSIYQPTHQIEVTAQKIQVDPLAQLYAILPDNQVVKYHLSGEELFRFNNNTQGALTTVDVTNPLTVLLYYGNFQTIILLDRTMNEQARLNLLHLNIPYVSTVGLSVDNKIWIYDETNFRLKKIDQNGQTVLTSADLSLLLGIAFRPDQIIAYGNWVFVNDPQKGILVFDQFGQYHKTIPEIGVSNVQVFDDFLICQTKRGLFSFHLQTNQKNTINLPTGIDSQKALFIVKGHLFLQEQDRIEVYQIK